jgi:hypothetical protein
MNGTECSKCGSKDTQKVQVFILMNTTVGKTSAAGVGYSRKVGVAVAGGGSTSVSENVFVSRVRHLDPGREPVQPLLAYLALPFTVFIGIAALTASGAWQ